MRTGRAERSRSARPEISSPNGLTWTLRRLVLPSAMRPHPPSEFMRLSDPSTGWTPLPLGIILVPLGLPFLPFVLLLRALRVLPWTLEARAYPWGRRFPPVVHTYEVRGREEARIALARVAEALARGDGAPEVQGADRVD